MCDKPLAILLPTVGMPHLLLKNPVENKKNKKSWMLSNAFDSGILRGKSIRIIVITCSYFYACFSERTTTLSMPRFILIQKKKKKN